MAAPSLKPPDYSKSFVIDTDASKIAIGAALQQEDDSCKLRPIAFASCRLKPAETRYHSSEQEALAVEYACEKFRPYILGAKTTTN